MPQNVDRYFKVLGDAKKYADVCAERDRSVWIVTTSSDYGHTRDYAVGEISQMKIYNYSGEKVIYRADPKVKTLTLTMDEWSEWLEYLQTERPQTQLGAFKGGMFKTETEKGIVYKIQALLGLKQEA